MIKQPKIKTQRQQKPNDTIKPQLTDIKPKTIYNTVISYNNELYIQHYNKLVS